MYVCVCVCVCVRVCVCVYVYICIYIYVYAYMHAYHEGRKDVASSGYGTYTQKHRHVVSIHVHVVSIHVHVVSIHVHVVSRGETKNLQNGMYIIIYTSKYVCKHTYLFIYI